MGIRLRHSGVSPSSRRSVLRLLRLAYGGDFTIDNFIARAKEGRHRLCRHVLADVAGILGRAVAGACNIFTPKVVVAGDYLPAGELFVQPLREAFSRHANSPRRIGNGSYDRSC
ncbi:hypothetical protein MPLA_670020 [Mesorhizobium sp. ORS 3359]|nr:hypothetical protein MPLA_670020 [Mesorhizobium sp. ORS 3359]